jgi:hypothetical protein
MKDKVKFSTKSKLKYVDDTKLEGLFSFLVIKVDSIVKKFGSIKDFAIGNDISGVTNGKLVVIYEMTEPPPYLYKLADEVLIPAGLKEYDDYVIASEQYLMIADSLPDSTEVPRGQSNLNQPIPICEKAPWLGSVISDIGNFVWDKSEQIIQNDPNLIRIVSSDGIVIGQITLREKYRLRVKMTSPFIGSEYESSLWPPRTTIDTTFLSSRGDKVARELLTQSYEIIKELDDNLDDIVRSYDYLEEELFEIRKMIPSSVRNRIESKIHSSFFGENFICSTERGKSYVEEIIKAYKNNGQKIYLREEKRK